MSRSIEQLDREHFLHPFTDHQALHREQSREIVRAQGVYITDAQGNTLLDGMAGLWCVNLGYGRQELVDAATRQMQVLPYYNSFFKTTTAPAARLAGALAEVAPAGMSRVFFTGSGSEANDSALRMVRHYWALKGRPEKTWMITRDNAYHGSTVAGTSLGGMAPMHRQGGPWVPDIAHVRQPWWFGEGQDMSRDAFGRACAEALEAKILAIGPSRVAAFMAEPVQGAGGAIIPPESYWPAVRAVLARYDILLVMDEVICGFGRLGHWFGSQHYELAPDLITFAKGVSSGYLPLGGVLVNDRVADTLIEEGGEFFHGFTYSGHPTCAAVALKNIELMREEQVVERVANELGPCLSRQWSALEAHPLVGEARSLGLIGALELVGPDGRPAAPGLGTLCRDASVEAGLMMRSVGNTLIISPPLVITPAQIDELIQKVQTALDHTLHHLTVSGTSSA